MGGIESIASHDAEMYAIMLTVLGAAPVVKRCRVRDSVDEALSGKHSSTPRAQGTVLTAQHLWEAKGIRAYQHDGEQPYYMTNHLQGTCPGEWHEWGWAAIRITRRSKPYRCRE